MKTMPGGTTKQAKQSERNEFGCALRFQTGSAGVKHFSSIVARMSPELRAAFEAERRERQAELEAHVAAYGYRT